MGTCVFTGWGEGTQQCFVRRGFAPQFNPLFFNTHFLQKSYAFRNPDIKNGTVFTCFHKNTAPLFYSLVMKLKMIMSPFPLQSTWPLDRRQ